MPTNQELRDLLGLPRNTKARQVLNHAIRRTPGGAALLEKLEKLDYLRIQNPANQHVAAEVGKLRAQRDQLADDIRDGKVQL